MTIVRKCNAWLARSPLFAYVVLVLAIAFALYKVDAQGKEADTQLRNERAASLKEFQQAVGTIVAVQIDNCQSDRKFRVQYKLRGEAEKLLLGLFVGLAQQQVEGTGDPPPTPEEQATAQEFIDQFQPLLDDIKIIPIPPCGEVDDRLKEDLEGTGITIPTIDIERKGQHQPAQP